MVTQRRVWIYLVHPGLDLRICPGAPFPIDHDHRSGGYVLNATGSDKVADVGPTGGLRKVDVIDHLRPVLVTHITDERDLDSDQRGVRHGRSVGLERRGSEVARCKAADPARAG